MDTRGFGNNQRMIFSSVSAGIGVCALASTFVESNYSTPALVVMSATVVCAWAILLGVMSRFAMSYTVQITTIALNSSVIVAARASIDENHIANTGFVLVAASVLAMISASQQMRKLSLTCFAIVVAATGISQFITLHGSQAVVQATLCSALLGLQYVVLRHLYIPVVNSLAEASERAEIFSTITRSSREFHSREPEEAIRNIVNVTKALGYVSVSVVSFDRRQKIFEDGVPIPNVMDIAVRASATRRVTITEDENTSKNPRMRQGDIVGVPIWINGRYSAALIVQTSAHTKVTQRECEALELLADQAGRALENAGKAAMDRRVVERLTDESQRDKLTGLGNRRYADLMVASLKVGDVIAMVDLDGLKQTNDVYGHASGDELLHEVGVFLAEHIRNPDLAARLGGDEFMILLRNADDGAPAILERLLRNWAEKKFYDTTFSMGMAIHRHDKSTRQTVEAADEALYAAKKQGKNRLVCAPAA